MLSSHIEANAKNETLNKPSCHRDSSYTITMPTVAIPNLPQNCQTVGTGQNNFQACFHGFTSNMKTNSRKWSAKRGPVRRNIAEGLELVRYAAVRTFGISQRPCLGLQNSDPLWSVICGRILQDCSRTVEYPPRND
jgi:hypothetical protein